MRPSPWDYVREAFNAKPWACSCRRTGPRCAFGLAGYLHDPGWLVLGAGVGSATFSPRHQRPVPAVRRRQAERRRIREVEQRWQRLVACCPTSTSGATPRWRSAAMVLEQQFLGDTAAPGFARRATASAS
jgi:hypothetical protein